MERGKCPSATQAHRFIYFERVEALECILRLWHLFSLHGWHDSVLLWLSKAPLTWTRNTRVKYLKYNFGADAISWPTFYVDIWQHWPTTHINTEMMCSLENCKASKFLPFAFGRRSTKVPYTKLLHGAQYCLQSIFFQDRISHARELSLGTCASKAWVLSLSSGSSPTSVAKVHQAKWSHPPWIRAPW